MHTVAPVAPSQRISRSVRQRGGYAGKRRDWSHPRVHISHSLIGRGVLLLGVRPPLMNRWVRREDGGDNKSHSYICAVFVASFHLLHSAGMMTSQSWIIHFQA